MNKKYVVTVIAGVAALLLTTSVLYSQSSIPKDDIKKGFDEIQASLGQQHLQSEPLVEGAGIKIPAERFIFFKKNAELVNSLQSNSFQTAVTNDEDIINELIATDLSLQYAKNLGLNATTEEIDNAIEYERAALDDPDPANNFVKEIMENRIRITGLSEDEFWESEETRYNYEKAIIIGKLATKLIDDGEIQDISEFSDFQKDLLNATKSKLKINTEVIEKLTP